MSRKIAIMTGGSRDLVRDNQQINSFIAGQTTLGRGGLPDDIDGIIATLLSEDKRWINAKRIEASDGMFI
jgi:NAD(P)-dependent dehydrogenase (short-subunit alcohol dehydrogenase family)